MPKRIISTLTGITRHPKLSSKSDPLASPSNFRLFNCAGIAAAIGLASLPAFLTLAPLFTTGADTAHAEGAVVAAQNLATTATVDPTLALTADSVSIRIRPSALGTFKTGTVTANVSTNSDKGYTLYLSSDSNSLKHQDRDDAITSISATSTGTNMLANTWGYSLGTSETEGADEMNNATNLGLTYSPIPQAYTTIKETDSPAPSGGDSNLVTFGVKVDTSIPSGVYLGRVLFTAISNGIDYSTTTLPAWFSPATGKPITTLQEMTPSVCANVPTPSVTATEEITGLSLYKTDDTRIDKVPTITLRDTRDNSEYKVRKLADGNCWMVESLKLAGKDETHPITLTPADSNVATDFNLPAIVPLGSTQNSATTPYVSGGGTGGIHGATGTTGVNGTVLYNFYAATAGSGGSISSGNASQDICPKGWHLPDNEGDTSWNKLLRTEQGGYEIATSGNDYSSSKVSWGTYDGISIAASNPVGLQLTGYFHGSKFNDPARGLYWSRTARSANDAYYLRYINSNVYPQYSYPKSNGFAIRCVADDKTTPANATYLQDVNSCPASLPEGEQYTLKDKRDEKEYTVAKLGDNKCWMTKNLNLAGGTKVTSADSHVTSDYTLPASTTSGFDDYDRSYVYNASDDISKCNSEGCGGYYSWKAATAGTSPSSGEASASICPKGWRLPTKSEFDTLKSYKGWSNSSGWTSGIFKGQLAGLYVNGSPSNVGSYGYYWSSTADSSTYAYNLGYYSSFAYTDSSNKRNGLSVRCVSRS